MGNSSGMPRTQPPLDRRPATKPSGHPTTGKRPGEAGEPRVDPTAFIAEAIVGNGSTVLDLAEIGAGAMIAAHSLVPPHTKIPAGVLAAGAPAEVKKSIEGTQAEGWVKLDPGFYTELGQRHRKGLTEVQP